jgi:membrane protease YdiL (CAAX protease family)
MIGLIVELILSWAILWLVERQNLSVLGLRPNRSRVGNLLFGFFAATTCCCLYFFFSEHLAHGSWTFDKTFTARKLLSGIGWTLKSVLFEELIFRGALLYIAIKRIGQNHACLLSAAAFGIYHWFSFGVLGNPVLMVIVFCMTGLWGLTFAWAFAKTKSMYLPTALHLGWDAVAIIVFSQGPLGQQLLIASVKPQPSGLVSLATFIFQILSVPLIAYGYLRLHKN